MLTPTFGTPPTERSDQFIQNIAVSVRDNGTTPFICWSPRRFKSSFLSGLFNICRYLRNIPSRSRTTGLSRGRGKTSRTSNARLTRCLASNHIFLLVCSPSLSLSGTVSATRRASCIRENDGCTSTQSWVGERLQRLRYKARCCHLLHGSGSRGQNAAERQCGHLHSGTVRGNIGRALHKVRW